MPSLFYILLIFLKYRCISSKESPLVHYCWIDLCRAFFASFYLLHSISITLFSEELTLFISLEMEIRMLVSILRTRCMDSGYTVLQMATVMKEPGMRGKDMVLECIHLEMEKLNLVTGKMEYLTFQARRTPHIQFPLLVSITPEYLIQCRYTLCLFILYLNLLLNALSLANTKRKENRWMILNIFTYVYTLA